MMTFRRLREIKKHTEWLEAKAALELSIRSEVNRRIGHPVASDVVYQEDVGENFDGIMVTYSGGAHKLHYAVRVRPVGSGGEGIWVETQEEAVDIFHKTWVRKLAAGDEIVGSIWTAHAGLKGAPTK